MSVKEDALYFYSRSANVPPGKGANERVEFPAAYSALSDRDNWRRTLSNFHAPTKPIRMDDGCTYMTIEHVFQAAKIRLADPEKAHHFTLESGHAIGAGDGASAQKMRKYVKLNKDQIADWDRQSARVMQAAAEALYGDPENAWERAVLLATNEAELWHIVPRKPPVRFKHLEEIRASLS